MRNFLYKRSHHLAARANILDTTQPDPSNAKSSADALSPTTSAAPSSSAAASSVSTAPPSAVSSSPPLATSSPSSVPTSSVPSSTSPSASASSSASAPSSSPTLSSPTHPISSPASSGSVPSPVTISNPLVVSTQALTGVSFTPTSTSGPSPSSPPGSSTGTNTGVIIGGVVGALAGIAALGFLLMWCMRRQKSRDFDDFDAQAFKRQSAILMDDPVDSPRPYNARPPTMIEQHNVSPALAAQSGYGGQNFYGSFGGYGQDSPYPVLERPQQAYAAPSIPHTGYNNPQQQLARQPSNVGYADYNSQQHLARQPSNAAYLTRQPSSTLPTLPPRSVDPNAHYIDLDRSSISPYQAAQYADISRQLGTTDPNDHVPQVSKEISDDPLPSPFDDPPEANPAPNRPHSPSDVVYPAVYASQRPVTHYEEDDAYSGI